MRSISSIRRLVGFLALLVFATAWGAGAGGRVVVGIGHHEVTEYTVRKYLDRFLAGARADGSNSDSAREWLGGFLARQVVIADLERRGYLERREVRDQVARMERHMLSASYGPYYDRVVASGVVPAAAEELLAGAEGTTAMLDGVLFASEAAARVSLGTDFEVVDDSEKMRRLTLCGSQSAATRIGGRFAWWQDPLLSVVDRPSCLVAGSWFSGIETEAGWAFFKVVSVDPAEADRSPAGIARREELRRTVLVKAHRQARLRAAQIQLDEDAVQSFLVALRRRPSEPDLMAYDLLPGGSATPLFSYAAEYGRIDATFGEFADFYNGLFVRRMPESLLELRMLVVDLVIGRLDLASDEAAAAARAPAFLRDRRDFASLTALALHEREEILPTIRITEDEIGMHYRARSADYARPPFAYGWRVRFATAAEAAAWRGTVGAAVDESVLLAAGGERVTYAFGEPIPDLDGYRPLIFDPRVVNVFVGPVSSASGGILFYKTGVAEPMPAPLEEVRPQIINSLQQDRIAAQERVIAIGLCAQFEVVDDLVPADFGIAGEVFKPWAR